jgi:tetratricopeptide (TPR) repeat protein
MRALVALVACLAAACGQPADPVALYDSAREAMLRGRLVEARDTIATALAAPPSEATRAALRILQAEVLLLDGDLTGASTIIDTPLSVAADPDGRLEARRLYLDGFRTMATGALEDGLSRLRAAEARARDAGAIDIALDIRILAGQALYRLGRFADADAAMMAARAEAAAARLPAQQVAALGALGMGQLVRERYDAALQWFEQALAFTEVDQYLSYAVALANAGICHARLGNLDRALELQERAVALHETRNVTVYLEQALGELGNTHLLSGDTDRAVALLGRARELAARAERPADEALWLDSSATALISLGRWDEARDHNDASIALKQARPDIGTIGPNLINTALIALGRGRHDDAIATLRDVLVRTDEPTWVQWQTHASLAGALLAAGRQDEGLAEFDRALAIVDTVRSGLLKPEYRITFLSRMIDFHRAYVEALVDAGQPERALAVADASRARVLAERFGAPAAARRSAVDLLRRVRESDSTALTYWLAPRRSFAWRVDRDGIRMIELPGTAEIDGMVQAYRTFIETSLGDPLRVSSSPADTLAAAVLAPLLSVDDDMNRLVIVPDGSLHGVNFETLPVGPDRHYLIERATISVAPALALVDSRPSRRVADSPAMLLVGDPEPSEGALEPLRYAGEEIDGIHSLFPGSATVVQRGRAASPQAFAEASPGRFSLIHFAAHATASATSPLDSSIELSTDVTGRFKLYARDVADRALDADLVTISACRGAGDRAYAGEGQVGLAWAFLRAGASRVIAGLWDVDDRSTALLMRKTYEGLAAGQPPAEALRTAKLQMLANGGNFAKPYYWGPFQLFAAAQ